MIESSNSDCYLLHLEDVVKNDVPEVFAMHLDHLTTIVNWAKEYLCHPHPQLGRTGPVCPFVPYSMEKGLFFLTVYPDDDLGENQGYDFMLKHRDFFLEFAPLMSNDTDIIFKTFVILFPYLLKETVLTSLEDLQQRLKPDFVKDGLMIGEFHFGPPKSTGLWNKDFYPLYSPIPLLVIRYLVPNDFYFLTSKKDFVISYLKRFSDKIPKKIEPLVKETCIKFDIDYRP